MNLAHSSREAGNGRWTETWARMLVVIAQSKKDDPDALSVCIQPNVIWGIAASEAYCLIGCVAFWQKTIRGAILSGEKAVLTQAFAV